MKIGLCLSGGGVKGAAHIGVIKALEEENIKFSYISGTSSGSIVATLYASGYSAEECLRIFKKYSKKINYIDAKNIFNFFKRAITKGKFLVDGLNSGEIIEKLIRKECNKKGIYNINDIKFPIIIPSVNLYTGEVYIFTYQKESRNYSNEIKYVSCIEIGRAVRASCSYPGIFSPCPYNSTKLIDGGIRENTPWKELKKMGVDKVINVVFEKDAREEKEFNVIDVVANSIDILCKELADYELSGADFLLKIKTDNISLLDTKKIDELYEIGYKTAKKEIKNIKKLII